MRGGDARANIGRPPGEFIVSAVMNERGGLFLARVARNALRASGRKSRLIRKRATSRGRRRRFTARGVSRRLIKTESALRPTETPCPTARTRSDGIFEARAFLLCTQARRVRETGLRRIIIPFQVNVLYLTMWVQRVTAAPGASPIRSYASR